MWGSVYVCFVKRLDVVEVFVRLSCVVQEVKGMSM